MRKSEMFRHYYYLEQIFLILTRKINEIFLGSGKSFKGLKLMHLRCYDCRWYSSWLNELDC